MAKRAKRAGPDNNPVELALIKGVERYVAITPIYSELGKERKKLIKMFNDNGKRQYEGVTARICAKVTPTRKFSKDLALELLTKLGATAKQIEACYADGESCEWVIQDEC